MPKVKSTTLEVSPELLKKMVTVEAALVEIEGLLDEENYKEYALHILNSATYNVIEEQNIEGGKKAVKSAVDEYCMALKKTARFYLKHLDQDD